MKVSLHAIALSLLCSSATTAETVVIDYALDSAIATIDPFTVPNPEGGADITISPSITLGSGDFRALFENADSSGIITDGDTTILGVGFTGEVSLALESSIDLLGFPIPVEASISGPLGAQQQSESNGMLVGLSLYAETTPGAYDIEAGPLDCSDNVLGLFCAAIEAALGTEFPLDGLNSTSALPFTGGIFSDLNPEFSGGNSSLSNQIDFSFPLTPELEFGVEIDTGWVETGRMILVPEPSAAALLIAGFGLCLRRSR